MEIKNSGRIKIVMIPAIGISFINPITSFCVYIFIVVVFIILTALGRGEIAMSLPVAFKPKKNNYKG